MSSSARQVVELVSDYLEGALARSERRRFERISPAASTAPSTSHQMRATIALTGRLAPEDLTPQMREEFTALYRRWRSEEDG